MDWNELPERARKVASRRTRPPRNDRLARLWRKNQLQRDGPLVDAARAALA
jgi:hypothetical protein